MSTTKENIILALLDLGQENGLSNVSLSDIAKVLGIRKASLYSHFESSQAMIEAMLSYCQDLLRKKSFVVDFKAKDAQSLLVSLANSFIDTFLEKPLSSYLCIVEQQRLFSSLFHEHYRNLMSMFNARLRVALEYCIQRSWLEIPDTDLASDIFASSLMQGILDILSESDHEVADQVLDRMVQGLLVLFPRPESCQ